MDEQSVDNNDHDLPVKRYEQMPAVELVLNKVENKMTFDVFAL